MGSRSLLQGIFPTQGLNPGLPHCRQILYQQSHLGSPRILEWVAYPFSSRSCRLRNQTGVSCIAGRFFKLSYPEKPRYTCVYIYIYIHSHTYIMEYSSSIKKDKIMPFAVIWRDLEIIPLNEVNQTNTNIWDHLYNGIKKWYKWTCLHNRKRLTDIENKLIFTKQERQVGGRII